MSRTTDRARRQTPVSMALLAVAVIGVAASLTGCGAARSVPRSPGVTIEATAGTPADTPADTPSGAGTPITPTPVPIRQDDLDELGTALTDGTALTTEVESDMAKDSTE